MLALNLQVGIHADARRVSELRSPLHNFIKRSAELSAQWILVGIDFQPAFTADRREQMCGVQQTDSAAKIVRAISKAMRFYFLNYRKNSRYATPLRYVRLHDFHGSRLEQRSKSQFAGNVFPCGQRSGGGYRKLSPLLPWPIRPQRLLNPFQFEFS